MNRVLTKLWLWIWHLLPANPILTRVVHGASRRPRHFLIRTAYLGLLAAVVLFSLVLSITGQSASLAELAKGASQTFSYASMTQLALMCFLAPVFTAGAITQERDAQTFNILLATPLTNAQIVFGSLMSRLYFVMVLLIAGLPIFLMIMVYGGVTTSQVVESFALSASTAALTGALAIFVAMIGVGTRRTIFSFFLMIGLYLLSIYLLGQWRSTWIEVAPANLDGDKMSWLAPLHPFLALDVALNRIHAPSHGRLTGYSSLMRYALAHPSAAYVIWTSTLAFLLTTASIIFVRRGTRLGETTFLGSLLQRFTRKDRETRTRPPRSVWNNPVAWREAKTRASGGSVLRWAIIICGAAGLGVIFLRHVGGTLPTDETRQWLAGVIIIQFAIAMIIAANTAATSMTKEKELKSMDLMLTTPLTSKYILWGKLRGLVSFTLPLIAVPVGAILVFGLFGLFSGNAQPAVWIEASFEVAAMMVVFTACACVISLHVSLKSRKNVTAVMYSVALLIFLSAITSSLSLAFIRSISGEFGAFVAPFGPFTSMRYLVDPAALFESPGDFSAAVSGTRIAGLIGTIVAVCGYSFLVWSIYTGLVRSFDMIMRKQSGT